MLTARTSLSRGILTPALPANRRLPGLRLWQPTRLDEIGSNQALPDTANPVEPVVQKIRQIGWIHPKLNSQGTNALATGLDFLE